MTKAEALEALKKCIIEVDPDLAEEAAKKWKKAAGITR